MQQNNSIFESLFNRPLTDPGTNGYLKDLAEKHPYFSPAQFYLLHQTATDAAAFGKQVLKTNLFFNNPLWLNFQLSSLVAPADTVFIESQVLPEPTPVQEVPAPEEIIVEMAPPREEFTGKTAVQPGAVAPAEASANDTDLPEEPTADQLPMNIHLKLPEETGGKNEELLFEPMHLVDYFASQGIRLSEEVQAGDKLGKQLKSFTEWLKTMKKIHISESEGQPGENDENIQTMAENSNTDTEVTTEAMAEVFAKQGKTGKATELYQKLSLLNPAKSTYFAAKIDNLKGI